MNVKRILLPTDFSDTAQRALEYAGDFAARFGAALDLLHVIPDPMSQPWAGEATGLVIPDLLKQWTEAAEKRLAEIQVPDVTVERVTRVGHAFVEIIGYAKDRDVDLIVMGTHGRGPIKHMLLGSVAEKVVRKAPCPVLTVRQPDHVFVPPVMPTM